jgi:hypothetical protein
MQSTLDCTVLLKEKESLVSKNKKLTKHLKYSQTDMIIIHLNYGKK